MQAHADPASVVLDGVARGRARARILAAEAMAPGALLLLALFLRVYGLEAQAWVPDTYEQMAAAERLTRLEFPLSRLYPPGIALTMAPVFLVLPATLASVQAVIVGASIALVAICYMGMRHATQDRVVATLAAAGVATAPLLVYFSRDGLFDVVNTMWIVLAFMLVPAVRGKPPAAVALYGALLAVAVTVRVTNAAFLPALLIWWTGLGRPGVRLRDAARSSVCRETLTAGAVLAALFLILAYLGGWLGQAVGAAPVTLSPFAAHAAGYVVAEFGGLLGFPVILPLALLGAVEVSRRDRALLYAATYMLVVWPLVHSPLPFANVRYMLPAFVFALMLVAHAPAAVARLTRGARVHSRAVARSLVVFAVGVAALYFIAADIALLRDWHSVALRSDETAMRELRPVVAALPPGGLLISPATRGVRESNGGISFFDLIDYSLRRGNGPDSVSAVLDRVARAQTAGQRVYYLHSRVEVTGDTFAGTGPGYEPYFAGLQRRFHVTEIYSAVEAENTLYEVGPEIAGRTTP